MLEYKTPSYENYRLLDEIEQYLFIYENSDLVLDTSKKYIPLWCKFDFLVDRYDKVTKTAGWDSKDHKDQPPNKWRKASASIRIFDRIVDDVVDLKKLENSGPEMNLVFTAYMDYFCKLQENRRCDFAHLQQKFLEFLNSEIGTLFLEGNDSKNNPGIKFVMVDEYQDTNPIQEKIYFTLAKKTYNLCVVGDDDQSLYRFRGGTVDCMVTYDKACETYFGFEASTIKPIFLKDNYRSHPSIVNYYNQYIKSFDVMNKNGARVSEKPLLEARSGISGGYPSFACLTGKMTSQTAANFAIFVKYLLDNSV
jgi:DNA helicase-2/ATP-dependent DNA helicase PcrA